MSTTSARLALADMASHLNTPRAVLLADQPRTALVVSAQPGQNRAGRRHVWPKGKTPLIPKSARRTSRERRSGNPAVRDALRFT